MRILWTKSVSTWPSVTRRAFLAAFGPGWSTASLSASLQPLTPTLKLRHGLCEPPQVEASSGPPTAWRHYAASERLLLT